MNIIFRKRRIRNFLEQHKKEQKERVKKDKPLIDYIRDNFEKSNQKLAEELNTTISEIRRIIWAYLDALENDVFYKIDVEMIIED